MKMALTVGISLTVYYCQKMGPQVARLGNTGCSIMDKDVNMQKLYAIRTVQV